MTLFLIIFLTLFASQVISYPYGTSVRIGPAVFPAIVLILLSTFVVFQLLLSFKTRSKQPRMRQIFNNYVSGFMSLICDLKVPLSMVIWALSTYYVGSIFGTILLIFYSVAFVEHGDRRDLAISLFVSLLVLIGVFRFALNMQIPLIH